MTDATLSENPRWRETDHCHRCKAPSTLRIVTRATLEYNSYSFHLPICAECARERLPRRYAERSIVPND